MKTVVFYYSQSGQALRVAHSICQPLADSSNSYVVYKPIIPQQTYPFPWSKDVFFDTFPETRLGMPPSGIVPTDLSDVWDADIVVIVGQSWFLSPSLPIQSFLADETIRKYLNGRPVVFVNACRNMWLMTGRKVKTLLKDAQAKLVGHIVLQDDTPNLISVITIIRWLICGKKEGTLLLPSAGIAEKDIEAASRFGEIIYQTWQKGQMGQLQNVLIEAGAIKYKPSVLFTEKAGHRMLGLWAQFIRKKGDFRDSRRRFRPNLFYIYLLTVLFVASPFGVLFFYLTYPLQHVRRHQQEDCYL